MKKLYLNIIWTYAVIITLLSIYLFCLKIPVSSRYKITLLNPATSDTSKLNALIFQSSVAIPLGEGSFSISYSKILNSEKIRSNVIPIDKISLGDHLVYHIEFKDIPTDVLTKDLIFDTFFIAQKETTVFSILFQNILKPFKH